ncbi:MAG: hypothetical protein R2758_02350 [Bacteroidales bacterium]
MRKPFIILIVAAAFFSSCHRYHDYSNTGWSDRELPEWEDLTVNSINTVRPHASMVSHLTMPRLLRPDGENLQV